MSYLSNIENAKAVPAPKDLTKDVINGRYLAAMIELDRFEKNRQEDQARIAALLNQLDEEQQLQDSDDQANYIASLEATIEEQSRELKHKDRILFNLSSRRQQLERKLEVLNGETDRVEFPKGTGRIYALREMSKRYPGVVLKGNAFVVNGEVVGELP